MPLDAGGGNGHIWSSLMKGCTPCTSKSRSRKGQKVSKFTPHYACGNMDAETFANWLVYEDSRGDVSCNYYIASDGTIWGIVPEELGPWTSSSAANDEVAITVEIADVNDATGEITQEAWNSLVALAADVCSRYGFSLQWDESWSQNGEWNNHKDNSLTIHRMFSSTDCPGQYLMDHLSQLANEVNSKIGAASGSSTDGSSSASGSSSSTSGGYSDALSKIPAGVINLEFSYGYNDGQMSEVHRGVMTEYDISFDPTGATLTIEGVSLEFVSFNDPNSVTYKGMTIEEIIRSIAEEEGWIIDDDSIEPIADVKESVTYSLTTAAAASSGLTNVYDDNSSSTNSGSTPDSSANATQQKVIDAANARNTGRSGFCAEWVSQVFNDAGLGYPSGDACDMYDKWCTSTDRSQLKPGMIIAIHPSPTSNYGHIGIYIGNDTIRHNAGGTVKNSTVDEWIKDYTPNNATNVAKWGWVDNKDLSQQ